jgi:hypothetical protein
MRLVKVYLSPLAVNRLDGRSGFQKSPAFEDDVWTPV